MTNPNLDEPVEPTVQPSSEVREPVGIIVAGDGKHTVSAPKPRVTLRSRTGKQSPWRQDPLIRARVGQVIHLMVGGFRRHDELDLLNLWNRQQGYPEVSERSLQRYRLHAAELYAESEGVVLGEVRAMFTDLYVQNQAIIADSGENALVRSTALKEKRENAFNIARLSGWLDAKGGPVV